MDKNKLLNGLTDIRKDLAERRGYDYSGVGYLEYVIQKIDTGAWKCDECNENNEKKPMNRSDILDAAKKCVCGQREQDYGTPESNFQLIADLWNVYINKGRDTIPKISATDVAMMMSLMKIARIKNGGGTGDSFVDLAGYAACGGEINSILYADGKPILVKKSGECVFGNCMNCKHHNPEEYNPFCDSCSLGDKWEPKEDE